MVGVPSKHGGCTTCRRRKKRCDKKTPFCSRCVEAGLVCEGYTRNHSVWINSIDGESHKYATSCGIGQTPTTTTATRRSAAAPPATTITLHESLARIARADRYVGLYLAAFLPNGRLFSRQASQISSAGWLRHHDELCRSEKTLRLITLAHGLSMLATRDDDSHLKLKGFEAHRLALQEMHRALQDPQRATGDGILAAVRLFRFYEILYGAESNGRHQENPTGQVNGYYAHTDGEMALFMNRGCRRRWSEAGMYLLVSGRIVSFILGVGRRKCSPFSDSQWMSAPWKGTPKSPLDELTDVLVQIPGLLERLDNIRASSVAKRSPKAWNDLLDECIRIEQTLLAWKATMSKELRSYDYIHYSDNNPLPMPQVDRDFAVLHMSALYWSCSILLYTTIHMATNEARHQEALLFPSSSSQSSSSSSSSSAFSTSIPFSSPGSPNYHNERNPTLHAHRIIHTMPLSHGPLAGGYGALCSTFPLGMALRYLVVAHLFPHEGEGDGGDGSSQATERAFLHETVSQPFMRAYTARFIGHLHKVDTRAQSLENVPGWHGVELRMKRWWFGPIVEPKSYAIRNPLERTEKKSM
ncbi:hypothetical protein BJY01DRAFT_241219 [Aspergillus pseudoustus]|uniref:Zn(2)-C6 fungal-type domain-containing protein n=1 Tax=Aspergillus pseudoustus TaxID=1810923 RepID=A0ABR4IH80_9EURO